MVWHRPFPLSMFFELFRASLVARSSVYFHSHEHKGQTALMLSQCITVCTKRPSIDFVHCKLDTLCTCCAAVCVGCQCVCDVLTLSTIIHRIHMCIQQRTDAMYCFCFHYRLTAMEIRTRCNWTRKWRKYSLDRIVTRTNSMCRSSPVAARQRPKVCRANFKNTTLMVGCHFIYFSFMLASSPLNDTRARNRQPNQTNITPHHWHKKLTSLTCSHAAHIFATA